jgi:phosphatidylglycerophosphatase A
VNRSSTNRFRMIPTSIFPNATHRAPDIMNARTDITPSVARAPLDRPPSTVSHKPRFAVFLATAFGLGDIPFAPGTWGSLAGLLIYSGIPILCSENHFFMPSHRWLYAPARVGQGLTMAWLVTLVVAVSLGALGVWASGRTAEFSKMKDPQFVVIDEVCGQIFTYLIAFASANWKYLLLGLILFRVFDIWKPFPARQAESLPGGWGIMADDWIAGAYAGAGLWLARTFLNL